jgi:hypothetical protein
MIDNFAIPAATIRGLFDYEYRSDRLILRPRVPGTITSYVQKQPVRFGEKSLYLSCDNGGPVVENVEVNGTRLGSFTQEEVVLMYNDLPREAKIEITTTGGWPEDTTSVAYPVVPAIAGPERSGQAGLADLPDSLQKPYEVLTRMKQLLEAEQDAAYERAFVDVALKAFQDYRARVALDPGPGYYRPISPERRASINRFYASAALALYKGLVNRIEKQAAAAPEREKRVAALLKGAL